MAKCRNCKKEIDATATRCPYCHTEMPTSDFLNKFKSVFIAFVVLGIFALAMYYFIINIVANLTTLGLILSMILGVVGGIVGVIAIGLFKNAKKWSNEDEEKICNATDYIKFGVICLAISLVLIALAFFIVIKLYS